MQQRELPGASPPSLAPNRCAVRECRGEHAHGREYPLQKIASQERLSLREGFHVERTEECRTEPVAYAAEPRVLGELR